MAQEQTYLAEAVTLARRNIEKGGRPFGAVVVKDGEIVGRGVNEMLSSGDPTSHAELNALRSAAQNLHSPRLEGASVYASGQPCPMCLAAMRMAGIGHIAYAYSNQDGAAFGMSTAEIATELSQPLAQQNWATIRYVPQPDRAHPAPYAIWADRTAARG